MFSTSASTPSEALWLLFGVVEGNVVFVRTPKGLKGYNMVCYSIKIDNM
jgi:hypothetical protein